MYIPRSGSTAKECTEVNKPERTIKVPKSDKENVTGDDNTNDNKNDDQNDNKNDNNNYEK